MCTVAIARSHVYIPHIAPVEIFDCSTYTFEIRSQNKENKFRKSEIYRTKSPTHRTDQNRSQNTGKVRLSVPARFRKKGRQLRLIQLGKPSGSKRRTFIRFERNQFEFVHL